MVSIVFPSSPATKPKQKRHLNFFGHKLLYFYAVDECRRPDRICGISKYGLHYFTLKCVHIGSSVIFKISGVPMIFAQFNSLCKIQLDVFLFSLSRSLIDSMLINCKFNRTPNRSMVQIMSQYLLFCCSFYSNRIDFQAHGCLNTFVSTIAYFLLLCYALLCFVCVHLHDVIGHIHANTSICTRSSLPVESSAHKNRNTRSILDRLCMWKYAIVIIVCCRSLVNLRFFSFLRLCCS